MKVYLASPFFNEKEIEFVSKAEKLLRQRGYEVYSPREHENREEKYTKGWAETVFKMDINAIQEADITVALYDGNYSDSGTAWECGYTYGLKKPLVAVHLGEKANLMIFESARANISIDEIKTYDFENLPKKDYAGDMI